MTNTTIITAAELEAGMEIVSHLGSYIVEDVTLSHDGQYVWLDTTEGEKMLPSIRKLGLLS